MGAMERRRSKSTGVTPRDSWASGDRYESYVGRWSRQVARQFVGRLPVADGGRWLDVGCGTGAVTSAVLELCAPTEVVGVEPSPEFRTRARATVLDPRVSFRSGDAEHLPEGAPFDAVVAGLVLNFVPDRAGALEAMSRAARRGGVVAAYVWDYAEGMQFMRHFWDAAMAVDPAAAVHDEGARFPFTRPEPLGELFSGAGLGDVVVEPIDVPTVFRNFDDFWTPFLGGTGSAPAYAASLAEPDLDALRDELRRRLPFEADGSIRLTARAWSASGWVPHGSS
jgi:SAM-dependent methyltransferase